MEIAGFQPVTLSDYSGHVAAIVFTQGCNFRCPFCHNGNLLELKANAEQQIPEAWVHEQLIKRCGQLTGVVITGGEPTIQGDLLSSLRAIKALGYAVKLDTNGSRPRVLKKVIDEKVVDFIAMDMKAPFEKYTELAGVSVDASVIRKSIAIIVQSGLPHEFRTTYATPLLNEEDIDKIKEQLPDGSPFRLQSFNRENALDQQLRTSILVE